MKFSLNFIKELFDPKMPADKLAHLLTMSGLEIEHLGAKDGDWIFDAEVTPNRSDWLSIYGIALECACLSNRHLAVKLPKPVKTPPLKDVDIVIEDIDDCPVYIARLITKARVGDTPAWLRERVVSCGLNSINNVVDITNYCMLKWGNPLHAFDFDKIKGNVYIRRAKKGEKFIGLDDKERALSPDNLVISDETKVIALAGVMGAKNAEVDGNTENILLEAAIFSPLAIRRSRRAVSLDTESSYRFERTVSACLLEIASYDAARLIAQGNKAKICGYRKVGKEPRSSSKRVIFSFCDLDNYIGEKFARKQVRSILKNLGFKVGTAGKNKLVVCPPALRSDIERDVDVFEEITRIYGYNRIKETLPALSAQLDKDKLYNFKKDLRNFLVNLGLDEVITFSLSSEDILRKLKQTGFIKLLNPLRSQENVLRTHLLVGMVQAVRHNLNQKNRFLKFFEIANIYKKNKDGFVERPFVSLAVTEVSGGFFYLKGFVEQMLCFLNIEGFSFLEKSRDNFLNSLEVTYKNKTLGFIGKFNSDLGKELGLKDELYFAQLDIELMAEVKKDGIYKFFSRYPSVCRDISLKLSRPVRFKEIETLLQAVEAKLLSGYEIVDVYNAGGLSLDCSSFTLRIFYHSKEGTLTSEEVDRVHNKLREALSQKEGIVLR